jgi:hypothetical protein
MVPPRTPLLALGLKGQEVGANTDVSSIKGKKSQSTSRWAAILPCKTPSNLAQARAK